MIGSAKCARMLVQFFVVALKSASPKVDPVKTIFTTRRESWCITWALSRHQNMHTQQYPFPSFSPHHAFLPSLQIHSYSTNWTSPLPPFLVFDMHTSTDQIWQCYYLLLQHQQNTLSSWCKQVMYNCIQWQLLTRFVFRLQQTITLLTLTASSPSSSPQIAVIATIMNQKRERLGDIVSYTHTHTMTVCTCDCI